MCVRCRSLCIGGGSPRGLTGNNDDGGWNLCVHGMLQHVGQLVARVLADAELHLGDVGESTGQMLSKIIG